MIRRFKEDDRPQGPPRAAGPDRFRRLASSRTPARAGIAARIKARLRRMFTTGGRP